MIFIITFKLILSVFGLVFNFFMALFVFYLLPSFLDVLLFSSVINASTWFGFFYSPFYKNYYWFSRIISLQRLNIYFYNFKNKIYYSFSFCYNGFVYDLLISTSVTNFFLKLKTNIQSQIITKIADQNFFWQNHINIKILKYDI